MHTKTFLKYLGKNSKIILFLVALVMPLLSTPFVSAALVPPGGGGALSGQWTDYYDITVGTTAYHDDPTSDQYTDSSQDTYVMLYDGAISDVACPDALMFSFDATATDPQSALTDATTAQDVPGQLVTQTPTRGQKTVSVCTWDYSNPVGIPVALSNNRPTPAVWTSQSPLILLYEDTQFELPSSCSSDVTDANYCYPSSSTTRLLTGLNGGNCPSTIKVDPYKTATTATETRQTSVFGVGCIDAVSTTIYIAYNSYAASSSSTTPTTGTPALQCPVSIPVLNWVLCPMINAAFIGIQGLNTQISNFLYVPNSIFSSQYNFQATFNNFRDIALALLVIVGLVMVVGQSSGLEIFAAYTVRKVLPRLVVAIIVISVAWPLLQFANTFFDDIGSWTSQLIGAAIAQPKIVATQGTEVGNLFEAVPTVLGGVAIPAIAWTLIGAPAFIALIFTALLALFVGFLVLSVRQLVIVLCILTAPLAIAAAVMPGTDKLYRFWRDAFVGALLMFPIIMGFLAAGAVMSYVAAQEGTAGGLLAVIVYFAPYFLLSVAFRLTTGIMSTFAGGIQGAHGGAFTALKKKRQTEGAAYRERRYGRPALAARSNFVNNLQSRASRPGAFHGVRKLAFGGLAGAVAGYNLQGQMSARQAAVSKELNDQIATGDDSEIRGLTVNKAANGSRREIRNGQLMFQTLGGAWVSEAAVDAGHKRWGNDTFAQQTALSYEMRKATSEDETQGIARNFHNVADSWGMSAERRKDAWVGSAFENQNKHLEYKAMSRDATGAMSLDQSGQRRFVGEIYERLGSYPVAQMGSNTVEQLKQAYLSGDDEQKQKVTAIAQTFMHEFGSGGAAYREGGVEGEAIETPSGRIPRQASTPGAAHMAERVSELAKLTGVKTAEPSGYYDNGPEHAPTPNEKSQT